jgi:hypothetical protein
MGGEEMGGEESPLLAAPGRREDDVRHYDKSSYSAKNGRSDKRRKYATGPHRREDWGHKPEAGTLRSKRSKTPGSLSMVDFKSLVGLEERKAPTYTRSEINLAENTSLVRQLVQELENKEAQKDET